MKKFLPFARRQPSLDRYTVNRGGWAGSDKFSVKSMRRTSAASLNRKSIQVVRGAYNIDLNKVDSSFTKLHRACLLNDDAQVRKNLHKVDNDAHDSSHRYPLHLATVNGNSTIVKLLIENNANPNVQDNESNTPLIKSIECGHEHLVKYLLSNGADPNISDSENNTALHWAILTESIIAIDALLSSKKCDLSLRNNKDETCLHLAVRSPLINTHAFETMMIAGPDLKAKDQLGLSAVDIAQACNNKIAMSVFEKFIKRDEPDRNTHDIDPKQSHSSNNEKNLIKLCEDYKSKYAIKNQENLEHEKMIIQLNAEIERLTLDMNCIKEMHDKLKKDCKDLTKENTRLRSENVSLMKQLTTYKHNGRHLIAEINSSGVRSNGLDGTQTIDSSECRNHKEFLLVKASQEKKIKELQRGLMTNTKCDT